MSSNDQIPSALKSRLVTLSKAGYRALQQGRPEESRQWFEQLLQLDPRNSYALVGLGELARREGDLEQAAKRFSCCLEHHPRNPYALKGSAECAWECRDYRHAVELWELCREELGEEAGLLAHLGDGYRRLGEIERARRCYQRALELDPDHRYALNGFGNLLFDDGQYREAAAVWEKLRVLDPRNIRVLTALGNCHRHLGEFRQGLSFFEEAGRLERVNFYVLYGTADCLRGLKDHEGSLQAWEALLEQEPQNRIVLTRAGDTCWRLGEMQRAEDYYLRALSVGFDLYAELGLARIQTLRGQYPRALERLKGLLEREPLNARVVAEASECRLAAGDPGGARSVLLEYVEQGGADPRILDRLEESDE